MNAPKFTMCIIAKNESLSLVNLLTSLTEFRQRFGEIIVLDTGSTDDTAHVAESMGASVVKAAQGQFTITVQKETAKTINTAFIAPGDLPTILTGTKVFNYGAARNYVAKFTKNDMICIPDADETFVRLDIDAINALIDHGWNRFKVWFSDTPTNRYFYDARWYDRRIYQWHGTMHETLQPMNDNVALAEIQVPVDACAMEHHQVTNNNRKNYLANIAYARFMDPTNERQVHCFARQLMYERRSKSAIAQFMEHVLMKDTECLV